MSGSHAPRYRPILLSVAAILLAPSLALAQSPWERAANNLALTFTGPLAVPGAGRDRHRRTAFHVRRGRR
jgi:hypothetical protein